ncbi:hypothetical protein QR680_012296 [Steinernema hermaphroditum]|uniref:Cytoplasmic dynein 2 heavy chain 1 n=1 Tax=Steinernema hermaphroditum TaxID=289476 RepID=A0AA39I361_9BILA|nr:hypothetical protein QR680_012296 [Steinernema hermaphroditum]
MKWRTAASTILFHKTLRNVLLLRRGGSAKFMPNMYVFPGGIVEDKIDDQFPIEKTNFSFVKDQPISIRGFKNDFPLRVAALRELFEETGILMVVDDNLAGKTVLTTSKDKRLRRWREKIREDPSKFHEFFTDYRLDLHSLQPWSNWLTPSTYTQRFDTVFFVIPVDREIEVDMCDKEMSGWKWVTPKTILEKGAEKGKRGILAPPQYYELTRLLNTRFNRLSAMCNPYKMCPQLIIPKEDPRKTYEILPGDHLYENDDEFSSPPREMHESDISKSEVADCVIHRITHFQPNFSRCQLHVKNVDRDAEMGDKEKTEKDPRVNFLLRVASYILSLNLTEEKIPNAQAIYKFVDGNAMTLVLSRNDQKGHVDVSNEIRLKRSVLFRVIFYKGQPSPLDQESFRKEVSVLTSHGDARETLLGTIQQVFSKAVVENGADAKPEDGLLASLVTELEENLAVRVVRADGGIAEGVASLADEFRFWKSKSTSGGSEYWDCLVPFFEQWSVAENAKIEEVAEILDVAEDSVEALWNADQPYPQNRMKQLLRAIGVWLMDIISKKLPETLWTNPEAVVDLKSALSLCDQWLFTVKTLTESAWPRNYMHEWKGAPLSMDFLGAFRVRISEILRLRTLSVELGVLLKEDSLRSEVEALIDVAMSDFAPFGVANTQADAQWQSRVQAAEKAIEPLVFRAIPVLKSRFVSSKLEISVLLNEISKYKHFLDRPKVKSQILAEREHLLNRFSDHVNLRRKEWGQRATGHFETGRFLTDIAAKIIWIRRYVKQMELIRSISNQLLNDLSSFTSFKARLDDFLKELSGSESLQYDQWCQEVESQMDDPASGLALETTGRLMEIDARDGFLRVSYSDRLVRLLREVRQLSSMGFTIPQRILNCVKVGDEFYQNGILLKQVAHFYNTIEQQMLPCQQAMLLDEAVAFERLVIPSKKGDRGAEGTTVTWNDPKKLKEFIDKLHKAAEKLTTHNRKLRKVHSEIVDIVKGLMVADLAKDSEKWAKALKVVRSRFAEEERVLGSRTNMRPWEIHWDRQLYKALQLQYRWGIESLHTQIAPIHAQLFFREERLQLRPPLEEIRVQYYRQMRSFLSIPFKFRGVQENDKKEDENGSTNKLFASMVERNATRFEALFAKAEQLFDRVAEVEKPFKDWVVLGQVDLEGLIDEKFKRASDWGDHLKLVKAKGREAEKLPSEIKIDCIVISTSAVKAAIDDLLQRLYETLIWTLKHSITTELQATTQFLTEAITVISTRPQSIAEVAEANQNHSKFAKKNKELKELMALIDEKNQLLRSAGGGGVEQLPTVVTQWENFQMMLDSHQTMIADQLVVMRENVDERVRALNAEAEKLFARWQQFKPSTETLDQGRAEILKTIEFVTEKRAQLDELTEHKKTLLSECEQFELPPAEFPILDELEKDIVDSEQRWTLYQRFNDELATLAEEEWIVFRSKTYLFDEFLQKWTEELRNSPMTHISVRLGKEIDGMKEFSACLKFCRGEMLSSDHWLELFRLVSLPRGTTLERLKFSDLISVHTNVVENVDALKNLNARAQGEVTIREAIQELELWAAQTEFHLTEYKHTNGSIVKVIKEWRDSINQVKDSQALLQSLKNSPFYAQFSEKTSVWETRLADLDQYLQWMNEIQRKWIYLEPIFGRGSLPSEASRFNRVDVEFRAIMKDVAKDPRLVSLCSRQSLRRTLEQIIDQLNRCQKALNNFLEEKRKAFPRFYFLGDDDLLEILGQSTNATVIQAHLKKLFQGIDKVVIDESANLIAAMVSAENEQVPLAKPVRIVPQVEIWLQELSDSMRETIRRLVAESLREETVNPAKYPSQVLCLSEQIRFCRDCESVISSGGSLPEFRSALEKQLEAYTATRIEDRVLQLKLKALVLDLIHHIKIVDDLVEKKARSVACWTWQRQLRFYLISGSVYAKQVNTQIEYTYEYQGNAPKLVHTPLTDKCYLTLTQAMAMGLGGNPYGPAGTGKTESIKALASLLGRQVLVFNCDEGIDVHSMSRIFVGIVQCGAWGCFDEFNRLDQTVLSAVSTQIQTIQDAIRSKHRSCTLGTHMIPVDSNSGIFITLNPAGKGYGGRQKLPDNLKQLFRPVVMSVPDNQLIAETLLYSEGFTRPDLARKLVEIFALSREMLSAQQHYDWGLRALKTVLRGCGDLLARNRDANQVDIVVQALTLNTLSKLTFADAKRFQELVKDVFPECSNQSAEFVELQAALEKTADEMGLAVGKQQMTKIFELYEQLRQRTGVVLVGPSGSGKSTLWQLLKKALGVLGNQVTTFTFNPKSMSRTKLLGWMDLDTREWTDGVMTAAARQVVKEPSTPAWIICDGDIDPEWIEALNSVLDDNKLLTMPSGERIQFGSNVNFIFETDSLVHASPATVSRMGMIFVSEENLDPKAIVDRWWKENADDVAVDLRQWIDDSLLGALDWVLKRDSGEFAVSQSPVALIRNVLSLLSKCRSQKEFLVALFRGLSAGLPLEAKRAFASDVVFAGHTLPDARRPDNVRFDERTDSLTTYSDDPGMVPKMEEIKSDDLRPLVLTAGAQRTKDTIEKWLREGNRAPFLLVGPDGCGKESVLKNCFEADGDSQAVVVHCSAQTSAKQIEQILLQHCVQVSSATGRVLKPKEKPNLVLYLKALNLLKPDKYGTSELVAFLHQMLVYRGYYDANLDWVGLENVQLVSSICTGSNESRHQLPSRFVSLLLLVSMEFPTEEELITIYSSYLQGIFEETLQSPARIEALTSIMVRIFVLVRKAFPSGDQPHFVFTCRALTNWTLALTRYEIAGDGAVELLNRALLFEAHRIFADRLVTADHHDRFSQILVEVVSSGAAHQDDYLFVSAPGPLIGSNSTKIVPTTRKDFRGILEKAVNRYEFEVGSFKFPLFDELIDLCVHVDRILTSSGGSVLLAGRPGLGRKAAVSIVAFLHQMKILSPRVSSNYGEKHFRNDLKAAMQTAAVENENVVFVIEDYQVLSESFLEMLNSVLSSGDVPGLFSPQEFDQFGNALRDLASQQGYTRDLYSFFSYKVHQNLHVAIIANVDSDCFVKNLTANPAFYKQANVLWNESWSKRTLVQIPKLLLKSKGMDVSDDIVVSFGEIFESAPPDSQTPTRFSVFIENYLKIFGEKRESVGTRLNRLRAGVSKLTETRDEVAKMQKKAAKKGRLLAEKQAEADRALKDITQSMTGANEQKSDIETLKVATEKEARRIEEQKALIEDQLKDVEPLLNEARKAVGSIKSESLSEIRSLRAPPEAVRDILQAVLTFMGILDTSWEAMRKFLAKSGVKEEIVNFDARRITPELGKKVQGLINQKPASFDQKNAKRASVAAAPLAAWVTANLQYSAILDKIAPLENEKNELLRNLSKSERQMEKLAKGLETVDAKVADLKTKFEVLMKDATQIKIDLDKEQATIAVAGTLVERLGSEFSRWQEQMNDLQEQMDQLSRCCIVSAAFITFLGGASERIRGDTVEQWVNIINLGRSGSKGPHFNVLSFLALETEQLNWKNRGLPADALSLQNTVTLFRSVETPLVIDATGRVTDFLQRFLGDSVVRLKAAQSDLLTQLELAVRFGKTAIVEDVAGVDPVLVPLLRREVSLQGPRQTLQFGEKTIDFHEQARLFLCTKNEQIHLPSALHSIVTVVNYSTTRSGLTSQLLSLAIEIEKPELELKSNDLTKNVEQMKIRLDELEQILLNELASSEGNLLENQQLLTSLNRSKENAETIAASLDESARLQNELNTERNVYLPFAQRASALYFAIADLHRHNRMYNYSVNTVIQLFKAVLSIDKDRSSSPSKRLDTLYRSLQTLVYHTVALGIFKSDRLMFALSFVFATHPEAFQKNEWAVFTGIAMSGEGRDDHSSHGVSWIPPSRRADVLRIQNHLPSLFQTLGLSDQATWSEFARSSNCENHFPKSVEARLTPFQRLLVIQAIRPDRLHSAATHFAQNVLGLRSINPPNVDFRRLAKEGSPQTPILVTVGVSADPSGDLEDLAAQTIGRERLHEISMGQGQQTIALETLRKCAAEGEWLCLTNLHLVTSFIPELQKELSLLKQRHERFRLWLTTEPDDRFPSVLLQEATKIVFEAPPGIRNNISRTLTAWRQADLRISSHLQAQALFVLAWLNALLQERRTFVPQGFSKFYEFSSGDVRAARHVIDEWCRSETKDWDFIYGLMDQVIYGGRIDNVFDVEVLRAYLRKNFNTTVITGQSTHSELVRGITVPTASSVEDMLTFVSENIPSDDPPSFFDLPANIRFAWEITESEMTLRHLRSLLVASRAASLKAQADPSHSKQAWIDGIGPIVTLWKRLNQAASIRPKEIPEAKTSSDPTIEILSIEVVHTAKVIKHVHGTLAALTKTLTGATAPDAETTHIAQQLINHQLPSEWESVWNGPELPVVFLEQLIHRFTATKAFLQAAESGQLLSRPVDLSVLLRPWALLNALRQVTARHLKVSMDELKLRTGWSAAAFGSSPLLLQLSELQIEGALFDGSRISEALPSSAPLNGLPPLIVAWSPKGSKDIYDEVESVWVPLYVDKRREKAIATVQIPCGRSQRDKWILASVAVFLNSPT